MITKIYNEDNLNNSQINETITRVKIYLINTNFEIIVASSNGGIQLPGGHVEMHETPIDACIREIQEETGIIVDKNTIPEPFFEIKHYTKNYKNTNLNRISNILYFYIKTDKEYNKSNINLTENEKKNKFAITKIPCADFEKSCQNIIKDINQPDINKVIAQEILESFSILKSTYNK